MVADTPLFVRGAAHRCQLRPARGFLLLRASEVSLFASCRLTDSRPPTRQGDSPGARGQRCPPLCCLLRLQKLKLTHKACVYTKARAAQQRRTGEIKHPGRFPISVLSEQHAGTAQPQIAPRTRVQPPHPTVSSPVPPAGSHRSPALATRCSPRTVFNQPWLTLGTSCAHLKRYF